MSKHQFANEVFDLLCQWITVGELRIVRYRNEKHTCIEWQIDAGGHKWHASHYINDSMAEFARFDPESHAMQIIQQWEHSSRYALGYAVISVPVVEMTTDKIESAKSMTVTVPAVPTTPQNH